MALSVPFQFLPQAESESIMELQMERNREKHPMDPAVHEEYK